MTSTYDVIVIGAGPAGVAAAVKARNLGLSVAAVDESPCAGGQVFRAPSVAMRQSKFNADFNTGEVLRQRLSNCGAHVYLSRRVWSVAPGFTVACAGADAAVVLDAPNLIVATGAVERHIPLPGWTRPGVVGLAAATILIKAHGVLPGHRTVVAGSGPLLALVASKILSAGGDLAAVVDAAPRSTWIAQSFNMFSRPDLLARGLQWLAQIVRAGVPFFSGSAIRAIRGSDDVTSVDVGAVNAEWQPVGPVSASIEADAVCLGFGLQPSTDIAQLLGAAHDYQPEIGGWVPCLDAHLQTSVPGLFVAGDAGGVRGADAAPLSGELAALGVAGRMRADSDRDEEARRLVRKWRTASSFGAGMSAISMPRPGAVELIQSDTTVCRCEGLTRRTLDEAIEGGARTLDDLKAATRCGMGPCGGRICAEAVAMLIAARTGASRDAIGQPSVRPPLRPVPLSIIAGDFNYDDLPIPAPAPL